MDTGYVKLWRKSIKSRVFKNDGLWKVWTWCLLKANHEKKWVEMKTGRGVIEVEVFPGQFLFGRDSAAKDLGMGATTVWKRMHKLKNTQNIDIESNRQYSLISVLNWDRYQNAILKSDSKGDRQVTGKCLPSDTNKNYKNDKNKPIKKKIEYPGWLDLDIWNEFKKYRTQIKAPLTDHAQKLLIADLKKLKDDNENIDDVINQTIKSGKWKGFYPVNKKTGPKNFYADLEKQSRKRFLDHKSRYEDVLDENGNPLP